MNTSKREQMWESMRDSEFRKQFVDEHIDVGIAFQIHSLRDRQNLTQANLAERLSVKQPLVSQWENPNYGRYTLATLKDLAKAFDVGLLVRFVPFSTLVDWTIDIKREATAPPSFSEEESQNKMIDAWEKIDIIDANQASGPTSGPDANLAHTILQASGSVEGRGCPHA